MVDSLGPKIQPIKRAEDRSTKFVPGPMITPVAVQNVQNADSVIIDIIINHIPTSGRRCDFTQGRPNPPAIRI